MMFNKIITCLDNFEKVLAKANVDPTSLTQDEENIILYFNLNLAKALMQDEYVGAEKVAKIILAAKGLGNEVTLKIE